MRPPPSAEMVFLIVRSLVIHPEERYAQTTTEKPLWEPQKRRTVFLSFEFEKDAGRRGTFIGLARKHCEFAIIDKSLPSAQHDEKWRQTAKERIRSSHVVIVLLGPDTHNAPGVKDELSLAGEVRLSSGPANAARKELRPGRQERSGLRVQMGHHQSDAKKPKSVCRDADKPKQVNPL